MSSGPRISVALHVQGLEGEQSSTLEVVRVRRGELRKVTVRIR